MNDGTPRLNRYLEDLRARLRDLDETERRDILDELRSHVRESAGHSGPPDDRQVADVIERLGSPKHLASLYLADRMLARAESSWSPWALMAGLIRAAALSSAGLFALVCLLVGYVVAISFFFAAVLKPFLPSKVGLWRLAGGEYSLRLGFGTPVAGEELLGWWIVPLGLVAGAAAAWLAARMARWGIARFRERMPLRSPRAGGNR